MKTIMFLILTVVLFGCSHSNNNEKKETQENDFPITTNLMGSRLGSLYFSRQPSKSDLKSLKKSGIKTVINLRTPQEDKKMANTEGRLLKEEGIHYYNIPFDMSKDLSDDYIQKVTAKVKQHQTDGNVLIHCSSGSRAAAWLGAHLYKNQNFSKDQSIKIAQELGLKNEKAERKLKDYLQ